MPDPVEILKAQAAAVAMDCTILALERKPTKPQRLQLDDALSILEHACANFQAFEEQEVQDALRDVWRGFREMEMAVKAVEDRRPSDPEPYEREDE